MTDFLTWIGLAVLVLALLFVIGCYVGSWLSASCDFERDCRIDGGLSDEDRE